MAEVDPQHLKAKGQDILQTKKYCITSKKSIHKFIPKIQNSLRSHELKGHGHF